MKKKHTTERYFAVRIGDPMKHTPYFMLGIDKLTPALFTTKEAAQQAAPKQPSTKVVRVKVQE